MRRFSILSASALALITTIVPAAEGRDLFQRVPEVGRTPQQIKALADLRALPTSRSVEVVRLTPNVLSTDLAFDIKPTPNAEPFSVRNIRRQFFGGRLSWVGKVGPAPRDTVLTSNQNGVTGSIFAPQGIYRIRPIGDGLHAFIRVDTNAFPQDHPPVTIPDKGLDKDPNKTISPVPPDRKSDAGTAVTTITVLVAYTADVEKKVLDPAGLAESAVALANLSYRNSGVLINLVLSPSSPLKVAYQESGDYERDLAAFRGDGDGKMDEVHAVRKSDKANLVVLLVDNSDYCGLASAIGADEATAFASVYHDCAIENLSFAHEIGHLQGARHNLAADPTPGHSHGHVNLAKKKRTVMAYPCGGGGCVRVPQWSRPPEWGNEATENNVRTLNDSRLEMSRWLSGDTTGTPTADAVSSALTADRRDPFR
jgi:peptidyl-Asp metalloendopeptidase